MATTMHFGPEWMRDKRPSKSRVMRSSPPPTSPSPTVPAASATTSYSSVLTPAPVQPVEEYRDATHPFRYSKDDIIRVWKEGGGRADLGLEVERWEGVVREVPGEPLGLKELSDVEKKLFSSNVNSELRRRVSHDLSSTQSFAGSSSRPKLGQSASSHDGLKDRLPPLINKKRKENGTDMLPAFQRKLSLNVDSSSFPSTSSNGPISTASPQSAQATGIVHSPMDGLSDENNPWSAKRTPSDAFIRRRPTVLETPVEFKDENSWPPSGTVGTGEESKSMTYKESSLLPNTIGAILSNLSLDTPVLGSHPTQAPSIVDGPPPGLTVDFSNVNWNYIDPSGQVQGPFPAQTMQKWHDQGYFTPDLRMRRINVDADWISLTDLLQLSTSSQPFLNDFPAVMPHTVPGIGILGSKLASNGMHPQMSPQFPEQLQFRQLLAGNLDSFLPRASPRSTSPGSSFGRGLDHLSSSTSPDQLQRAALQDSEAFATQSAVYQTDSPMSFNGQNILLNEVSSHPTSIPRSGIDIPFAPVPHQTHHPWIQGADPHGDYPTRPRAVDDISVDSFSTSIPSHHGFPSSTHTFGERAMLPEIPTYGASPAEMEARLSSQINGADSLQLQAQGYISPGRVSGDNAYLPHEGRQFISEGTHNVHPYAINTQPESHASSDMSFFPGNLLSSSTEPDAASTRLASSAIASGFQDGRLFANTLSTDLVDRESASAIQHQNQVHSPHATLNSDVWDDRNTGQSSPIASPVNVIQGEQDLVAQNERDKTASRSTHSNKASVPTDAPRNERAEPKMARTSKVKQRLSIDKGLDLPMKQDEVSNQEESTQPVQPKTAWSNVEEGPKVNKQQTPSLRDVQEREAKQKEARKVKERAARQTVSSLQPEEIFTTSWGLPTSQAGSRIASKDKDVAIASPQSSSNTPVWTNVVSPPSSKKGMKEIQEEEEKRKLVSHKEAVMSGPKRGYAETTTKPAQLTSTLPSHTSSWTTVGVRGHPSGSSSKPFVPQPDKEPTSAVISRGTVGAISTKSPVTAPPLISSQTPDNRPQEPSLDFLRWLRDSLKGLKSGVNVDEFIQWLLSFPVDPSSDVIELIREQAYANSTTIDGRKFAEDFVRLRKEDSFPSTPSHSSSRKALSLADVVKAPQKPPQAEWGYKVVKKKGKGAKANSK